MKIQFYGAVGTVTGSKYLLTIGSKKILIDCGLYQGRKELRLRNWEAFPFQANQVNSVLLTHAHIDHSGCLPLLIKKGFNGLIYTSAATRDLCSVLLPDCGHLQEEDAKYANKHGFSKHHPAQPLYTEQEAVAAMSYFKDIEFGQPMQIASEATAIWSRAGHIFGSGFIKIETPSASILFSGDMGRLDDDLMNPPAKIKSADYLVLESTYGDRLHQEVDPKADLANIINQTAQQAGTVLIPAFAVGRAQKMLYLIYQLKQEQKIPNIPVYIDSPMATKASKIMFRHTNEHRLSKELCAKVCGIANYVDSQQDSMALDAQPMPKIIISASGMATGGRVLHHIKAFAGDYRNSIVFSGFQAPGTRGADMVAGKKQIKIHGGFIEIKAGVYNIGNTSAHSDYSEILSWLENFDSPPRKIFITHGESAAANSLKQKIEEKFGWECVVPAYEDEFVL